MDAKHAHHSILREGAFVKFPDSVESSKKSNAELSRTGPVRPDADVQFGQIPNT